MTFDKSIFKIYKSYVTSQKQNPKELIKNKHWIGRAVILEKINKYFMRLKKEC